MADIFQYDYMIRAMLIGLMLGIVIPAMGIVIVNRRLSMIGDALSHVSLSGVLLGLLFGINPILGAIVTCAFAAFAMEWIRRYFPSYGELSTAIIMSTGVGLASVLSGFVEGGANFESFLFGTIVAVTDFEFYMILVVAIVVIVFLARHNEAFLYLSFDPMSAKLSGIPVNRLSGIFVVLTGLVVAISARTVGVLIISSLLVLPVACALQLKLSYKKTQIAAVLFGVFFTEAGLIISYYGGLKPGGSIVLLGVATLIILILSGQWLQKK
ncbi:MAG: metal ABC transporter permease [Firmicutes bacterium]|nr:metal ABC transporter permease [Bacillota bacterium]